MTVVRISAVGTRGDAKGKLFIARMDSAGRYVLNKRRSSGSANPTNRAVNKVFASTLSEAADLLESGEYLINLVAVDGKRALREFRKVRVETA